MKRKVIRILALFILITAIAAGFFLWNRFMRPLKLSKGYTYIYVERGDTRDNIADLLTDEGVITDTKDFEWLAEKMELDANIHPGKYRINNGMNLRQIINLIKYGKEEKVKLNYNSQIHDLEEFITYTADKLELTENELEEFFSDDKRLEELFSMDPDNAFGLITPGTYETGWAVNIDGFCTMLHESFGHIWNRERRKRAAEMGYSIPEVLTLASIVQNESGISSEQQKIAGVYINRLKKGMPLQADPTLKFANKKWDAQRLYDGDKEIDSPYNTYRYKGLPPGPISLVYLQSIDAVLHYTKHNYIYFCAKPELNGYSDFSSSYEQHMRYAAAYQKAMNRKGVK